MAFYQRQQNAEEKYSRLVEFIVKDLAAGYY